MRDFRDLTVDERLIILNRRWGEVYKSIGDAFVNRNVPGDDAESWGQADRNLRLFEEATAYLREKLDQIEPGRG